MRWTERGFARAVVALAVLVGAVALAPELTIARVDLNDSVFHYTIADRLVQRLAAGESVLDFWMPEWAFGYPVVRDYQPLGHWLVALLHFASFRQIPVEAAFTFLRWLLLALFPLSVYAGCRMTRLRPLTSAAAALLAPLVAAPNMYGIDYGSYIWRGNGLYTQLVAAHLFVLAVGAGVRAIREGRRITVAGILLGLVFLSHFIYGYMAAATLVLVAALPGPAPRRRFVRLGWVALGSIILCAFQIAPMLGDGPFINRSRWEPEWKWESFGAAQVLTMTASGDLLDGGRLPVLSLLALVGAIHAFRRRREQDDEQFAHTFALAGALLWLFLFCGRAAWGPLFTILGLSDAAQLHRLIGGAQWFLLILAAIGLTRLWTLPYRNGWRFPALAAAALSIAVLVWPIAERHHYLQEGYAWGRDNLASFTANRANIDAATTAARRLGGRTFPGLSSKWGTQFRVGYVPFYAFVSKAHVPAVAFLYHAMGLPADIMIRFDESRAEQYNLFDIRSAIADAGRAMPSFLRPAGAFGNFRLYQPPPSTGAFDLVRAPYVIHTDRRTFYDVNDAWLQSGWPAAKTHLMLDYESAVPVLPRPRLAALTAVNQPAAIRPCGTIVRSSDTTAEFDVADDDCIALFKSTYHPKWRATVDGIDHATVMLSPGFLGIPLARGRHSVEVRYAPGMLKPALLILAFPLLFVVFTLERRGAFARTEARAESARIRWKPQYTWMLLTFALVLPCIAPYAKPVQPSGHDALEYLPRVIDFHENVRNGIFLPRWAPDLSSGQGQPLFLVNPPLFYWLTEIFHLAGLPFIAAMNAAVIAVILGAAAAMFLLASWLFGPRGGTVAALAYVFAPYFLVELYVRTAFSEFTSFPFYPLAIYGFARHAAEGRKRHLILGAAAYAAIWFGHSPAAVLFSPVLGAFLIFQAWRARSVRLLITQGIALAVGLLLAATIWLPSVVESHDTHANLLTVGPLKYSNHYVTPAQFFTTFWGYGVSIAGDQDTMPFSLGWPLLLVAAAGLIAVVRWQPERKPWIAFFAGSIFVLCFLMTQRGHAVWEAIPQLQYVAFPWRFLAPATFCLALLTATVAVAIANVPEAWRNAATAAAIAIIVLTGFPHAKPIAYLPLDEQLWTPRSIAAGGVVAATFDTFEPRWVQDRPSYQPDVVARRGSAATVFTERTPEHAVWSVRVAETGELELPLAYFPGWRVMVDGIERSTDISRTGRMIVAVDPGLHTIDATFHRTPVRWVADLTSLAALLGLAALAISGSRTASRRTP